ncbi:MAG: hypothetical protein KDA77_15285 [Planctomycetaceae bacterium]|nr:hypothetical protein [Planctomycetaceae bacterium]
MRILFDQGTPVPLRRHLADHSIATAFEQCWSELTNGKLLDTAEQAGSELLITTDSNLQYQQNLKGRQIATIVLRSTSWPRIQKSLSTIQAAVRRASVGSYEEIEIPYAN